MTPLVPVMRLPHSWIKHLNLEASSLLLSQLASSSQGRGAGVGVRVLSEVDTLVAVTMWYCAPDCRSAPSVLLGFGHGVGGCMFELLLTQKPPFPGKLEICQVNKVFKDQGTPSEKIRPGYDDLPALKNMTFTKSPCNNLGSQIWALTS